MSHRRTTHIKAISYGPKKEAVRKGKCAQTIRVEAKEPVMVGDKIIFHSWSKKPYRSKWGWRLRVVVTEAIYIMLHPDCILSRKKLEGCESTAFISNGNGDWWEYRWADLAYLAELDGIDPPTGEELERLLKSMHGDFEGGVPGQIIRWGFEDGSA